MVRRWRPPVYAGLVVALSTPVAAQINDVPPRDAAMPEAVGSQASSQPGNMSASNARVLFVNVAEGWVELAQVIGDLLLMHQVIPHFEHRSSITERDLLEQRNLSTHQQATVWILMPGPTQAQLVFADPELRRFLVRDMPLPQGLDDMGRESIAQVVESSLLSLLEGKVGMSRNEVRNSLGSYFARSTEPPRTIQYAWPSQNPVASRQPSTSTRTWRPRLGVSYGFGLSGSDLGMQHGPGIVAGLEHVGVGYSLFAVTSFEWRFERHHKTTEFDLAVQSSLAWLLFGWRQPIHDGNFLAMAGPGLEFTRVNPTLVTSDAGASIEQRWVHRSPWARMAIGFEWDNEPLTLQLLGKLDVSAFRTRYVIDRNGTQEELASVWPVQPGLSLAVMWR